MLLMTLLLLAGFAALPEIRLVRAAMQKHKL